jgi:hypothetical protein
MKDHLATAELIAKKETPGSAGRFFLMLVKRPA